MVVVIYISRFDFVLGPESAQSDVYQHVQDCVPRVLDGYNSTIMAYGQTGSGKTHTMFGIDSASMKSDDQRQNGVELSNQAGVIPLTMHDLFNAINLQQDPPRSNSGKKSKINVYCSFVQIYNEQLFDMLRDGGRDRPLEIHEDNNRDIYVQGLSEFRVKNVLECLALIRIGEDNRAIRETHMNQASSRSHSVFQVVLEQELDPQDPRRHQQERKEQTTVSQDDDIMILRSKLNLIDLAGSEKWDTRQDIADQHAQELANINSSLFALGRCIAALCRSTSHSTTFPTHIPYRESKLTRLIQDSLGGNTKTYIIATLSPTAECADESISTLKFADRARQVLTYVRPNEGSQLADPFLVDQLQREISQLRALVLRLKSSSSASSLVTKTASAGSLDEEMIRVASERQLREECEALREEQRQCLAAAEKRVHEMQASLNEAQSAVADMRVALDQANSKIALQRDQLQQHEKERARWQQLYEENKSLSLDSTTNLRQRIKEAEDRNRKVLSLLARFFAFEIEEGDLRYALKGIVPNVDDYIGGMGASQSQIPPESRSSLREMPWASSPHKIEPLSRCQSDRLDHLQIEESKTFISIHSPPPSPAASIVPRLNSPPSAITYRIRGRGGNHRPVDREEHDEKICFTERDARRPHHLTDREREEQRLVDQLNRARKRMQRHITLQEWLIRKEQMELAAIEREENDRSRAEEDRRLADLRFRERARRQKKKLEAYYAHLRETAQSAPQSSTTIPRSIISTSPLPSQPATSLPPLPSPPRFCPS